MNRLHGQILQHWQTHFPEMVTELKATHMLEPVLSPAERRAADLLYQFLSVEKMQYIDAWDLAMRECLSPTSNLSPDPPATSG
jgi:hypothetical protein